MLNIQELLYSENPNFKHFHNLHIYNEIDTDGHILCVKIWRGVVIGCGAAGCGGRLLDTTSK